jgi:hypothetical protein
MAKEPDWLEASPGRWVLNDQPRRIWGAWHVLTMTGDVQPMKGSLGHPVFFRIMNTIDTAIGWTMIAGICLAGTVAMVGAFVMLYLVLTHV